MPGPDPLEGKRVLFVVNVDWFFLSHRLPLAVAARSAGAEVFVASRDTGRSDEIREHGIHFLPLSIARNTGHITGEMRTIAELARLYRAVAPDVIHHVTIKPVLYGSMIARVYRIPVINAISGFGYTLGAEGNRLLSAVVKGLYRIALRSRRSTTIFQNPEDLCEFTSRGFLAESRTALIHGSGVDCAVFRPAHIPPTENIVMFASRMLREKGVADFVEAARTVGPDYPGVRFVLIGDPDDSPSSVGVETLQEWNAEGAVEWWGHSTHMEDVLPRAAMFVLPTYYREGLPKVLLEAAACGIPMIATDTPGCRDIVRNGTTGLLVEPHDPLGIAHAIRRLLDDDAFRNRLGAQARSLATESFGISGVVDQTLALYRTLLQS